MVMASNTDPFGLKTRNIDIIESAFQLIGTSPETLTNLHVDNAFEMMNKIIKQWTNPYFLQFNEVLLPVKLVNNCPWYPLPPEILNVYDLTLRNGRRFRTGEYFTSSGVGVEYVFDNNIDTYFTQSAPNGTITIGFDAPKSVNAFGVLSAVDRYYKFKLWGSNTKQDNSWVLLYDSKRQLQFEGSPTVMNTRWFNIATPQYFSYYKLEETGGETISIREFYLEEFQFSRPLSTIGRSSYQQITTPNQKSSASIGSIQKANDRINVQLWGSPTELQDDSDEFNNTGYNFIYLRASRFPFDFKSLLSEVDLNGRFLGTFTDHLSKELAAMYAPNLYDLRKKISDETMMAARMQDNDLGGFQLTRNRS
jgi:hypothetical protein